MVKTRKSRLDSCIGTPNIGVMLESRKRRYFFGLHHFLWVRCGQIIRLRIVSSEIYPRGVERVQNRFPVVVHNPTRTAHGWSEGFVMEALPFHSHFVVYVLISSHRWSEEQATATGGKPACEQHVRNRRGR